MASPGELVRAVAKVLGMPEETIVQHDRNLAAAGKRTKGGRGLSAARMSAEDAANLLIAATASSMVKGSLQALEDYSCLKQDTKDQKAWARALNSRVPKWIIADLETVRSLPADHSFADLLSALINAASDQDVVRDKLGKHNRWSRDQQDRDRSLIEVSFFSPFPGCVVRIGSPDRDPRRCKFLSYGQGSLQAPNYHDISLNVSREMRTSTPDLKQERSFTAQTIFAIGACLTT